MKNYSLIFFLLTFNSFCQEIDLNFKLGKAINYYKPITPDNFTLRQYQYMTPIYDNGFGIESKFLVHTKYKLYYSIGLNVMQSKHYQKVIEFLHNDKHLGNIFIKRNRIDLKLFGVEKRITLYDPNISLSIGFGVVNSFNFKTVVNNSDENILSHINYIKYSYSLTTYHTNKYYNTSGISKRHFLHFSPDLKLQLRYKLKNNITINTGFYYTFSNLFFYDYTYTVKYYTDSSLENLSYTTTYLGFIDNSKYSIKDKDLYFNFGVGFNF